MTSKEKIDRIREVLRGGDWAGFEGEYLEVTNLLNSLEHDIDNWKRLGTEPELSQAFYIS